jgi:hypothetical protein
MAAVFFGLSVLVVSAVGWLWPSTDLQKPDSLYGNIQK